ncbi:Arsenical resistance operon repressor [uncultured Gammaproteobacteria bacterium]|jgi:ArsR family transcriptional regulator|nr:Arsenical resistance operon repressor [uncultured Gammaproteobacteria bacterium]
MNDFFKVLSDETRLRCLTLIYENRELCVCELIHALDLPQSKISRHLSLVKLNKLIIDRREGQWVLYSVHPDISTFKDNIIKASITELMNTPPFKEDRSRLHKMTNRPLANKEFSNV